MKKAMKNKQKEELSVYRMIIAKAKTEEKNGANVDYVKIVEKYVKERKDAITFAQKNNKPELIEKEQFEIDLLAKYLPVKFNEEKTTIIITDLINNGANNIGAIMKGLNQYGNMVDRKLASQIAGKLLK